jgi:hypothetical protein
MLVLGLLGVIRGRRDRPILLMPVDEGRSTAFRRFLLWAAAAGLPNRPRRRPTTEIEDVLPPLQGGHVLIVYLGLKPQA